MHDQSPCRLCGSDRFRSWFARLPLLGTATETRFNIVRCQDCELLQTRPEPSEEELRRAYGPAYTWQQKASWLTSAEGVYRQMLVRIDQARTVSRAAHLAGGTALLDIGCGDGLLIAEARRAGLHAYGIDRPNAPLWRGCDPVWRTAGDIESVDQPSESWDVVSLFHVAEHVRDPLQLFARIRGWLRPHGVLVVQVPNAASLQVWLFGRRWFGFDIPRHLTHWSEATLTRALRTTGYAVIARSYVSWRDNAPFFASSLLPSFDPLVERERARPGGKKPLAAMIALRRLTYLATVWAFTPLVLLEAALRRPAVITVLARKAP